MRRNSTTATFRFSVLVSVTGIVEVMRSYCCAALRASRVCSPAWPRTLITSNQRLAPTSAQAQNPATPTATMPRCSCQRK